MSNYVIKREDISELITTYVNVDVVVIKGDMFDLFQNTTTGIDTHVELYNRGVAVSQVAEVDIDNVLSVDKFYLTLNREIYMIITKGSLTLAECKNNFFAYEVEFQPATIKLVADDNYIVSAVDMNGYEVAQSNAVSLSNVSAFIKNMNTNRDINNSSGKALLFHIKQNIVRQ